MGLVEAIKQAVYSSHNLQIRPPQLGYVLAAVRRICQPSRLVVAGHSLGAYTALATGLTEPVDALIAYSLHPPVPQSLKSWTRPALLVTGTKDHTPDGVSAAVRIETARAVPGAHLEVLEGARHLDFADLLEDDYVPALLESSLNFLANHSSA